MFTYVIIAGIACVAMKVLSEEEKETSSKTEVKSEPEFGSYEYIRSNLRKYYYSNNDCRDIEWELKYDSDFRYDVQKNMRRGDNFQEAIEYVKNTRK